MVLVDSSVWVDFFNGKETRETRYLRDLVGREFVALGDLIMAEVLQGFVRDIDFRRAKELFDRLDCYDMCDYELALASAQNHRLLRRRGVTVRKTIDVIIATFCVSHHHLLLHADRDFERMREPLGLITL